MSDDTILFDIANSEYVDTEEITEEKEATIRQRNERIRKRSPRRPPMSDDTVTVDRDALDTVMAGLAEELANSALGNADGLVEAFEQVQADMEGAGE